MMYRNFLLFSLLLLLLGCSNNNKKVNLPILGPYEKVKSQKQFHPVPDFQLYNQYGDTITAQTFKNSVRVVDFFFISCPSICPKIQSEMLRIRKAFANSSNLQLISHTIDTKRDTIERLAKYATNLGIEKEDQWHFLTGSKDDIFGLADDYFSVVIEDSSAPGGFDHSGRIVLVDKEGYIRAFANGQDTKAVNRLIKNIEQLLDSYEHTEEQ